MHRSPPERPVEERQEAVDRQHDADAGEQRRHEQQLTRRGQDAGRGQHDGDLQQRLGELEAFALRLGLEGIVAVSLSRV